MASKFCGVCHYPLDQVAGEVQGLVACSYCWETEEDLALIEEEVA